MVIQISSCYAVTKTPIFSEDLLFLKVINDVSDLRDQSQAGGPILLLIGLVISLATMPCSSDIPILQQSRQIQRKISILTEVSGDGHYHRLVRLELRYPDKSRYRDMRPTYTTLRQAK